MKKFKLPAKTKAKWVAALRSGKFKQGQHTLKTETADKTYYCCLGVACEIGLTKPDDVYFVSESFLPEGIQTTLSVYNDGSHSRIPKSFAWIASYIERYL